MKLHRFLIGLLSAVTLLAGASALADTAQATSGDRLHPVSVGATILNLPVLEGFADPDATPPTARHQIEQALPPQDQLLGVMLSADFIEHLNAHQSFDQDRFYVTMIPRGSETQPTSNEQFAQLKSVLRSQTAEVLKNADDVAQQSLDRFAHDRSKSSSDSSLQMHMQPTSGLGIFDERPNSISLATLSTSSSSDRTGETQTSLVICMGFVHIRNIVVAAAVYAPSKTPGSIEWAKATLTRLVTQLNFVNAEAR